MTASFKVNAGGLIIRHTEDQLLSLVDWFNAECCRGTELVEGWYWHEDDGEGIGGPYDSEEAACKAAQERRGW